MERDHHFNFFQQIASTIIHSLCLLAMLDLSASSSRADRPHNGGDLFPEHYKEAFAKLLADKNDPFAKACSGDPQAMRSFIKKSTDKSLDGEYAEHQAYMLLKILVSAGDQRFSDVLRKEPSTTREAAGRYIDTFISRYHLRFPKTRSLYVYRSKIV
jgi:hypothetical protein